MSKILIFVLVLVLAVLGFFGFRAMNKPPADNGIISGEMPFGSPEESSSGQVNSGTASPSTPAASGGGTSSSGSGSIQSLVAGGSAVRCEFSTDSSSGTVSGIIYADGRGKSKIESKVSAMPNQTSYILVDGNYSYTWVSGMNQGFKMDLSKASQTSSGSQGMNLNQSVRYSCQPWTVVASTLALPGNITFSEMPVF